MKLSNSRSFVFLLLLFAMGSAIAAPNRIFITYPIGSSHYPVVLPGSQLPPLLKIPINTISLHSVEEGQLRPIAFQIDPKNKQGLFQIPKSQTERLRQGRKEFDDNDELVFLASDLGSRLGPQTLQSIPQTSIEVEIRDPDGINKGWVYILLKNNQQGLPLAASAELDKVYYNADNDSVESANYRIQFSSELPFLAESMQWRKRGTTELSESLVRTMSLVHTGKFLHKFPFRRTEEDYTSKLVAVKDGPVRVIRRTANRVHLFFGIGSPTVYVDYLIYPAGFVMDIIVDFPFKISLFFDDVTTDALLFLNDMPSLLPISASSASVEKAVVLGDQNKPLEDAYNHSNDTAQILQGAFGQLITDVTMEQDSPIETQVMVTREPANGIGFNMINWELLDSKTHHILFRAYLLNEFSAQEGLEFLSNGPRFIQ